MDISKAFGGNPTPFEFYWAERLFHLIGTHPEDLTGTQRRAHEHLERAARQAWYAAEDRLKKRVTLALSSKD